MLGISDANIVAEGEPDSSYESHSDGVELRYNRTDPGLVRDGVDVIVVTPAAADRYRIEYRGYLTGSLDVTSAGAAELGESLLGDRDDVPSWVVTSAPTGCPTGSLRTTSRRARCGVNGATNPPRSRTSTRSENSRRCV